MTNNFKRRRLLPPTLAKRTKQRPHQSSNAQSGTSSSDKGKEKAMDTFLQKDDYDVYSMLAGDRKQLKRYAINIAQMEGSGIELRPDGSLVITPPPPCQIPTEIITLILNNLCDNQKTLYQCTLVTKQFHSIANPLLWKKLNFRNSNQSEKFILGLTDATPQRLKTLGCHIRELYLLGDSWTDEQLIRWLPHIPHLERLAIYPFSNITDACFQQVPYHCQQLLSLKIHSKSIRSASFAAIAKSCLQLCDLEWHIWYTQSSHWLVLLKNCPLKRLCITAPVSSWDEPLYLTLKSWHQLTSLEICAGAPPRAMKSLLLPTTTTTTTATTTTISNSSSNNPLGFNNATVSTTTTTPSWPQLTYLRLGDCDDMDDTSLTTFIKSHPHLQRLHLYNAKRLTDDSLNAVAEWLPNIRQVQWLGPKIHITHGGIRNFLRQCQQLDCVVIHSCRIVIPEKLLTIKARNLFRGELDLSLINQVRHADLD